MSADEHTVWAGVHPLDWAALVDRVEDLRRTARVDVTHTWQAINGGDYEAALRRLNRLLDMLEADRHPAQPRCGVLRANGEECRVPVARTGYACPGHRRVTFDSRRHVWHVDKRSVDS